MRPKPSWFLAVGLCVLWLGVASGDTLWVATTGSDITGDGTQVNPYQTIQNTISVSTPGDTIRVRTGTYNECVDALGGVRVSIVADDFEVSQNNTTTIIDGTGICDGTMFVAPTVNLGDLSTLRGFTVTGGGSGGVLALGSVTVTRNVIRDNVSIIGGGIYAISSDFYASADPMMISYNTITDNVADEKGGGLFVEARGRPGRIRDVQIDHNIITNNTNEAQSNPFPSGAGLFLRTFTETGGTVNVTVTQNTIEGNVNTPVTTYGYGGGIWVESLYSYGIDNITISNNVIAANESGGLGGGVGLYSFTFPGGEANITLTANTIGGPNPADGNFSDGPPTFYGYGGGVYAVTLGLGVENVTIGGPNPADGNTITNNDCNGKGGGVSLRTFNQGGSTGTIHLTQNVIEGNTVLPVSTYYYVYGYGGGVYAVSGGVGTETIEIGPANQILGNQSNGDGGGITVNMFPRETSDLTVLVSDNVLSDNDSDRGGALDLFITAADQSITTGPALLASGNEVTGNRAIGPFGWAGGLFATLVLESSTTPDLVFSIERNSFRNNTAENFGGAAFFYVAATAPDLGGGATVPTTSRIRFAGNLLADNAATNGSNAVGGGLVAFGKPTGDATTQIDLDFNTVVNNSAELGAGGIEMEADTVPDGANEGVAIVNVTNSIVSNNVGFGVGGPDPGDNDLTVNLLYNDVYGHTPLNFEGWLGDPVGLDGNISEDPLLTQSEEYAPQTCSPTVDAADPAAAFSLEPEPNGGRANMGHLGGLPDRTLADPYPWGTDGATQSVPDITGDGLVDGAEILRISIAFAARMGTDAHYFAPADLDKSCQTPGVPCVDGDDLAYAAAFFGTVCP